MATLLPRACLMPELVLPKKAYLLLFLGVLGPSGLGSRDEALIKNVVRLVDKAASEYSHARQAILDQVAERERPASEMQRTGRFIYAFGFIDHMESCVNALVRAITFLTALRGTDKTRRRLIRAHAAPLVEIRDTLEHLDNRLDPSQVAGESGPIMLALGDDEASICLGEWSLSFSSLAILIRALHEEAAELVDMLLSRPSGQTAGE